MGTKINFKDLSTGLKIPIIAGWCSAVYIAFLVFLFMIGVLIGIVSVY